MCLDLYAKIYYYERINVWLQLALLIISDSNFTGHLSCCEDFCTNFSLTTSNFANTKMILYQLLLSCYLNSMWGSSGVQSWTSALLIFTHFHWLNLPTIWDDRWQTNFFKSVNKKHQATVSSTNQQLDGSNVSSAEQWQIWSHFWGPKKKNFPLLLINLI